MLAAVCMKWGTKFCADYVNVLYAGLKRHLRQDFKLICITDDAAGIHPAVRIVDFPDFLDMKNPRGRVHSGIWPKLTMFKPGILDGFDLALFLDLDVVILAPLDPMIDEARARGGLHIPRDWNSGLWRLLPTALRPDRGGQSSVVLWVPGAQDHIHERFMADPQAAYALAPNDQVYITRVAADRHYLPDHYCASFRKHCVRHYPLNLVFPQPTKPDRAAIVVFYRNPKPTDLIREPGERWGTRWRFGVEPVLWVQHYWQQGLRETAAEMSVASTSFPAETKPAATLSS